MSSGSLVIPGGKQILPVHQKGFEIVVTVVTDIVVVLCDCRPGIVENLVDILQQHLLTDHFGTVILFKDTVNTGAEFKVASALCSIGSLSIRTEFIQQ